MKASRSKEFRIDASTRLRELTSEDAGSLYALVDSNRKYLRQWLPWVDKQQGPDDAGQFIAGARNDNQAGFEADEWRNAMDSFVRELAGSRNGYTTTS